MKSFDANIEIQKIKKNTMFYDLLYILKTYNYAIKTMFLFTFPILMLSTINMFALINLTNIARENYHYNKQIERLNKDIDSIKAELLEEYGYNKLYEYAKKINMIDVEKINFVKINK